MFFDDFLDDFAILIKISFRSILVQVLEKIRSDVGGVLRVEKEGNLGGAEARLVEDIIEVFSIKFRTEFRNVSNEYYYK